MAGSRFALAGLVLLTWSVVRARGSFAMPSLREWRDSAIVGALLLAAGWAWSPGVSRRSHRESPP